MRMLGPAKRLTVYLGESDHRQGRPLHGALLETLRQGGLAGATVMRAISGFGAHSRIHTAAILRLSEDLPLVLEVVDTAERIDHAPGAGLAVRACTGRRRSRALRGMASLGTFNGPPGSGSGRRAAPARRPSPAASARRSSCRGGP